MATSRLVCVGLLSTIILGCGDSQEPTATAGAPGYETGPCVGGLCLGELMCLSNLCVDPGNASTPTTGGPDPTSGPGDPTGDTTTTTTPGTTTTNTTTTTTTNTTTTTTTAGGGCMLQLAPTPGNVVLVIETSGSMVVNSPTGYWDHDVDANTPNIPKWTSMVRAIAEVAEGYDGKLKLGSKHFPGPDAQPVYGPEACTVDNQLTVPVAANNSDAVVDALPIADGTTIHGGSPTVAGLKAAIAALKALPASEARAIVLLSDGPAHCQAGAVDTDELLETFDASVHTVIADAWNDDGIATIVVGVNVSTETSPSKQDGTPDGVNPYTIFNQMAVEGGRPRNGAEKFYFVQNEPELVTGLDEAMRRAQSCTLVLPAAPADPAATVVTVAGTQYPYDPIFQCNLGSGWVYTDGSNTAIQMCGSACTAVQQSGGAQVELDCP